MDDSPLLSICIPTMNRAYYLRQALRSIVSQEAFVSSRDVEIVVSDNCSTDNTRAVVEELMEEHPGKIRYFRNETNEKEKNFELVLRRGRGKYLKLQNDTVFMLDGALDEILAFVAKHVQEKPFLFFTNKTQVDSVTYCANLEALLEHVSFISTWIGGFGIWRERLPESAILEKYSKLQFMQTYLFCSIMLQSSCAYVYDKQFARMCLVSKKGISNAAELFRNYFTVLQEFVDAHALSEKVYRHEKALTLRELINQLYFDPKKRHHFLQTGYYRPLREYFSPLLLFKYLALYRCKCFWKNLKRKFRSYSRVLEKQWRFLNPPHQRSVTLSNMRDLTDDDLYKIVIGQETAGQMHVAFASQSDMLIVGNNVSIGEKVKFLYGANCLPYAEVSDRIIYNNAPAYGDSHVIFIDDNVSIGAGSVILAGVHIPGGSVVKPQSIVGCA